MVRVFVVAVALCRVAGALSLVGERCRRGTATALRAIDEDEAFFGSSVAEDVTNGDVDVDLILSANWIIRQALEKTNKRLALAVNTELYAHLGYDEGIRHFVTPSVSIAAQLKSCLPRDARFIAKSASSPRDARSARALGASLQTVVVRDCDYADDAAGAGDELGDFWSQLNEPAKESGFKKVSSSRARHLAKIKTAREEVKTAREAARAEAPLAPPLLFIPSAALREASKLMVAVRAGSVGLEGVFLAESLNDEALAAALDSAAELAAALGKNLKLVLPLTDAALAAAAALDGRLSPCEARFVLDLDKPNFDHDEYVDDTLDEFKQFDFRELL
ncbi:hypothetical protein M885DRAFT_549241 [Pelagophyceae sp. CCMP2097]|nr:hypothetical protein M885DRAFT_549241 [Pelagophyceae sp. CCMP2097]